MNLQEMVSAAQQGDAVAYDSVCRQFGGLVRKQSRQGHLAGIREEAESEAWLALAQAVKEYDSARGVPFAGYAERCVSYRLWNVFKKERRRWQTETPLEEERTDENGEGDRLGLLDWLAASDDVAGEVQQSELRDELRQAVSYLPARQRQAVVATLIGEARLSDLAEAWGISVQAVYATRKKGLSRLRQLIHQSF